MSYKGVTVLQVVAKTIACPESYIIIKNKYKIFKIIGKLSNGERFSKILNGEISCFLDQSIIDIESDNDSFD